MLSCKAKEDPDSPRTRHDAEKQFDTAPIDRNLIVQIDYDLSYRIDLEKETYTVFQMGNPDFKQVRVRFTLLPAEREKIIRKYYALSLHKVEAFKEAQALFFSKMNA